MHFYSGRRRKNTSAEKVYIQNEKGMNNQPITCWTANYDSENDSDTTTNDNHRHNKVIGRASPTDPIASNRNWQKTAALSFMKVRSHSYGAISILRKKPSRHHSACVPSPSKKVHFADSFGLNLVQVQLFEKECKRSISLVSSGEYAFQDQGKKTLLPLFAQPGSLPNFFELVRQKKVCLENAFLDSDIPSIRGVVRVLNMDYHKAVYIRWSLDGWKTLCDYQITYIKGSNDGDTDRFQFKIYAPLSVGQTVEFALCFHCVGERFWDNNEGSNYRFTCVTTDKKD